MKKSTILFIFGGVLTVVGALFGFAGERVYFAEETAEAIEEMKDDLLHGPDDEEK